MDKNRLKQLKQENDGQSNKNDRIVQRGLRSIYSNQDGSLPDISHLDVRRRARWKMLTVTIVVFISLLAVIAWFGFLVFTPPQETQINSVALEIKGEQSIASGDDVTYTLEYRNTDKTTLREAEIILRYPKGFNITNSRPEPSNEFKTLWKLGDLARGDSGTIVINGNIIGEVGTIKTIHATISYKPENFSSGFKQTTSFSNQITSSILVIDVAGPEEILPEKQAVYTIAYENSSDQDWENIKITVDYPSDFIFQHAQPEAFSREEDARKLNNQWILEQLSAKQAGEIVITGGYPADGEQTEQILKVEIGFLNEDNELEVQQKQDFITQVIKSNLNLRLVINGSTQDQPANFGQFLSYSIVYKNLGDQELEDTIIKLTIDSEMVDWEFVNDKNDGLIEDNIITWTKDEVSGLDILSPLDQGEINFTIKLKDIDQVDRDTINLQTKSILQATIAKIGALEAVDFIIEGNTILSNINTDLQLKVEARYFNDDNIAVGTGPLPPVVGETTTFRIYWSIANSLHEVTNASISTTLPEGIEWGDKFLVSAGSLSYSGNDRSVTWNNPRIPVNTTFEEVKVWFDVSVTPTKQQERKLLILADQATLTATDQTTQAEISRISKVVTSNLEDDPYGFGRGLVIDITE